MRSSIAEDVWKKMYEVEVYSRPSSLNRIFPARIALDNLTAFKVYTLDLLSKDWNLLLCVAESGEWLLKALRHEDRRHITLIVADPTKKQELINQFGEKFITIKVLPWWLHNQHMTIIVDVKKRTAKAKEGMFFERRHRSSSINPVGLPANECDNLLDTFFAYWLKAEAVNEKGSIGLLRKGDLKLARRNMFDKIYASFQTQS